MLRALLTPGLGIGAFAVGTSRRMRSAVRPNSTVRMRPNQRPQHSCSRPLAAAGHTHETLEVKSYEDAARIKCRVRLQRGVGQDLAAWCWNLKVAVRALRAVQH
jgi:hypothetical protein